LEVLVATNVMVAESEPVKAPAPLLFATNKPRVAVLDVLFATPGAGIMVVGEAAFVDKREKLLKVVQAVLIGQLYRIRTVGWAKLLLT
jgi:hypothetical protein